jgi:hypothetical protein
LILAANECKFIDAATGAEFIIYPDGSSGAGIVRDGILSKHRSTSCR